MDVFLIGYRLASATQGAPDLGTGLAESEFSAFTIRDWSGLTADETLWQVVADVPEARSVRETAADLGLEISHAMRLVPDRPLGAQVDWTETIMEILPREPPPILGDIIRDRGDWYGISATLLPDVKACTICGWIGAHDPNVRH